LARYLGPGLSPFLTQELERVRKQRVYERQVFFIRNLGFITPTQARRISFEESLRFEKLHEDTYRELDFQLVYVAAGEVMERVRSIRDTITQATGEHLALGERK
jgi:predicted ATPase